MTKTVARGGRGVVHWALFMAALVVAAMPATQALAKKGDDGSGQPAGADKEKAPKLPKEERRLAELRQGMGVAEEGEWRALQPHVIRVHGLAKQAKDLADPAKTLEPPKPPKPAVAGEEAPERPAYMVALAQAAGDVRRAYEDPATGADDIQKRLARYRAARDEAQRQTTAELAAARGQLRELLTARQELGAIVAGLLD